MSSTKNKCTIEFYRKKTEPIKIERSNMRIIVPRPLTICTTKRTDSTQTKMTKTNIK